MSGLPEEIIEKILSRLPVKSISRFRFNLLVSNFGATPYRLPLTLETNLYSVDYNNVLSSLSTPILGQAVGVDFPFMSDCRRPLLLGSCDGLVCLQPCRDDEDTICIWNPCTKEYKQVPDTPIEFPSGVDEQEMFFTVYGFGYDRKIEDYKLLRIVGFDAGLVSEARVYTLGTDTWRSLGFIPYNFSLAENAGFLLNGVLYWDASVTRAGNEFSGVLVSFDICNETFHDMPLPNDYSNADPLLSRLGMWEGKPCMLYRNHKERRLSICKHNNDHFDVWILNDNTWSKHLSITAQVADFYYVRPIQIFQNGEILFEGESYEGEGEGIGLVSYDTKLERARALRIHGFPDNFELLTYIETLVSLNSGTYVGQQQEVAGKEETDDN